MKLVSYRAPGGEQQHGEVLDGRVVAFDDGSTVKDRLASGDRAPASGPDHALDDVQDHMQPRFAITAGVAWDWTDEDARASDATVRGALAELARR